ncbi:MAG TPA: S9 family peptidase, partial [Acidobacteriaceae bacterium]
MFVRSAAFLPLLAVSLLAAPAIQVSAQDPSAKADTAPVPPDKYLWLEEVHGARAMTWVKAQDARSAKTLEADPRFAAYSADALKVGEDPNRLPLPQLRGDDIYNFWRDQNNVHGLLRKTSLADFASPAPHWQTVLDIDALGKKENASWVFHGMSCLYPGTRYCTIALSAGGEDASTDREFDLKTGQFVDSGFSSPHSKQDIAWEDKDTLLIAREWGPHTMTASGYPYIVKEWRRGTPLASAKEVFRGEPTDIGASGIVLHDAQGDHLTLFGRDVTFFQSRWFVQTPSGLQEIGIPRKAQPDGLLENRMLIEIHEDWTPTPGGPKFTQGSLLSVRVADLMRDPAHLHPAVVFAPTSDEFLNQVATTRSHVIVTTLKHVLGQAYVYAPSDSARQDGWTRRALDVPSNSTIGIVTSSDSTEAFFLSVTSFLTPSSLLAGDAATAELTPSKSEPAL